MIFQYWADGQILATKLINDAPTQAHFLQRVEQIAAARRCIRETDYIRDSITIYFEEI